MQTILFHTVTVAFNFSSMWMNYEHLSIFYCVFLKFILGCAMSSLLCRLLSSCSKQRLLFLAVSKILIAVASPVAEHGLQSERASVVAAWGLMVPGSRARDEQLWRRVVKLLQGMWDPPGPGIKLVSSALAGGSFTTEPPGKPPTLSSSDKFLLINNVKNSLQDI